MGFMSFLLAPIKDQNKFMGGETNPALACLGKILALKRFGTYIALVSG